MELVFAEVQSTPKMYPVASDEGWRMVAGHQAKVNDYKFLIIPMISNDKQDLMIFEKESGCAVIEMNFGKEVLELLSTQEDAVDFFSVIVVPKIFETLRTNKDIFDSEMKRMKDLAVNEFGKQPPETDIDLAGMLEKYVEEMGKEE